MDRDEKPTLYKVTYTQSDWVPLTADAARWLEQLEHGIIGAWGVQDAKHDMPLPEPPND